MLYIVPTPIGNLQDMTQRSIQTLQDVELILAEDTRRAGKLRQQYDITTPLKPFHAHNEHKVLQSVLDQLSERRDIALISDAGTPGISDPGFLLTRACRNANLAVTVLPGPTAFVPALVASGLPCDRFHFEGFLPIKKGRQTRLQYLSNLDDTIVLYESPHKIKKTVSQLREHLGPDRPATLGRELSKQYEEYIHGSLDEIEQILVSRSSIKGELVLVIAGQKHKKA